MNPGTIRALVAKDFALFFRNRFYAFITVLGLAFFVIIYFVMPPSVDEELEVGIYAPVLPPVFEMLEQEEGLEFSFFDSDEELEQAVTGGEYAAGVVLPADIMEQFAAGEKPHIVLYFSTEAPDEIKDAVEVMIRELAYMQTGQPLAIEVSAEVLGPDLLGSQISTRDRMSVTMVIMLIMFEMLGLASLITEEVEQGTIRALLVSPMSARDFFAAKLIMGVGLAFSQGVLFMAIVGGLGQQPLIILLALLLGSILFTGTGFFIASVSRDMLSSMGWGITIMLIYTVPTFGIMFPGLLTDWVKAVPTYYLSNTIHQAANLGGSWGNIWADLLILAGFIAVIVWGGVMVLRRKFQ